MDVALQALRQEAPIAKAAIGQQHIVGSEVLPESLEQGQFGFVPVPAGPSGEQSGRQTQEG